MTQETGDMNEFFRLTAGADAKQDFRRAALWHWISRNLIPGRVIDIGGGAGYIAYHAAVSGYETILAEPDATILQSGEEHINASGGSLRVLQKRAEDLDVAEVGRFENILSLDVLEHIEDDVSALRSMAQLLAANGQMIITVPAMPSLYGKRDEAFGHYRRHTPQSLRTLITGANLKVVEMRWWNLLGVPPYFFYEKVLNKPIADNLRKKSGGRMAQMAREVVYQWLRTETYLPMPRGLSLLAVAHST